MKTNYYFVDEAGDITLFTKRKKPAHLGSNGISKYFMIGVAQIEEPEKTTEQLEIIRQDLLNDPTLKNIPSMAKTSIAFHACNDCQAVRREVFKFIETVDVSITIAIKDKRDLINYGIMSFGSGGNKITEKEIYSDLIKRLFKNLLHQAEANKIVFAERGTTFSNYSLKEAINIAKKRFETSQGIEIHDNHEIVKASTHKYAGLQITDYLLWALQRMYERKEDYYFNKVADKFSLIMDLDDTRNKNGGELYNGENLLTLEKIKP